MSLVPYVATVVAGVLNAIHSGTNAELNRTLGRPLWASVLVILISGTLLLAAAVASREALPGLGRMAATPWWAWLGTAIAAVPIITTVLFAGQLGAAAYNGIVVTATIICSLLLDRYGLVGFDIHRLSPLRIVGGMLMVVGVTLISIF